MFSSLCIEIVAESLGTTIERLISLFLKEHGIDVKRFLTSFYALVWLSV